MYSEEEYHKALEVYEETRSVTRTMTILGYPERRQTLYNWINRKRMLPDGRATFRGYNTPSSSRPLSHCKKLTQLVLSSFMPSATPKTFISLYLKTDDIISALFE